MELGDDLRLCKSMRISNENDFGVVIGEDFGNESNPEVLIWLLTV